jgi:hypothetical protein
MAEKDVVLAVLSNDIAVAALLCSEVDPRAGT